MNWGSRSISVKVVTRGQSDVTAGRGHRPRNGVASGSWNSQGNGIILVVSIKNTLLLTLISAQ